MFGLKRKPRARDNAAAMDKMAWDLDERAAILRRDMLRPGVNVLKLQRDIDFLESMSSLYRD